ncbi:MAG: immunoglobulin domain-containing protein [Phycisphaeraceae bacterium]|nr:immunoglobulin domain-containing protein [Phycisphaeraceae bacterium]
MSRTVGGLTRILHISTFAALALGSPAEQAHADCPNGPPVNASDGLCGSVQLSWGTVQGAVGYDVVRNTINTPTGGTPIASNIPANFFNDGSVTPQETYFYFVRARVTPNPFDCSSGVGFWGPSNTGWAAGPLPTLVFNPLQDVDTSGCAPVITFGASNRGTVELYRNVPPNEDFASAVLISTWTTQQAVNNYSFIDTGAPAGPSTYWFRRVNACANIVNPPFVVQRAFAGAPDAPASFAATNWSVCDAIVLSWPAAPGAQFYNFEVFLTPQQVIPTDSFQIVAQPVPPGGEYTHIYEDPTNGGNNGPMRIFRMRVENLCGLSPMVEAQGFAGGNPVLGAPACTVVTLGSPATLQCPVGIASAYQWLHDGVPLIDDGRISGSNSPTLQISSAVAGDVGEYVLRVTGACGVVNSPAAVLAVRTDHVCAADFDGNGTRDVSDIFAFLSAWFAGCP